MTPSERRKQAWQDYTDAVAAWDAAQKAAEDERIRQAFIAEYVRKEMLKERAVEAQEKAAQAAMIQALNPPIIIQQQQQQQ